MKKLIEVVHVSLLLAFNTFNTVTTIFIIKIEQVFSGLKNTVMQILHNVLMSVSLIVHPVDDNHTEKLCFTQFNARIYGNRSLAASGLY